MYNQLDDQYSQYIEDWLLLRIGMRKASEISALSRIEKMVHKINIILKKEKLPPCYYKAFYHFDESHVQDKQSVFQPTFYKNL